MKSFNEFADVTTFILMLTQSPEWLALQDKTQVFNDRKEGVKSRGSHCEDVGLIAQRLTEALKRGSEEERRLAMERARLTGLIHDLGHIPFGHAGEAVANSIISEHKFTEPELANIAEIRALLFGKEYSKSNNTPCFEHNENSVIQFIIFCEKFGFTPDREIMEGILAHSTSRYEDVPKSLVNQAVRLADKLAYINYDIDDLRYSFPIGTEERKAIDDIYDITKDKKPFIDPDGNIVRITLSDGRILTLTDFVKLDTAERINILVNESIREAQEYLKNHPEKQGEYETHLTGCNDIMVEIAKLKDQLKAGEITQEQHDVRKKELERELYKRSPIMYLAYDVKRRTDGYIRTGQGLSLNTQTARTFNAQSAVGNYDLKNEYIYKSLVTEIENVINKGIIVQDEPLKTLLARYAEFKKEQNDAIQNYPGNEKGIVFPEIYTIVNFIGIHSNTELTRLAHELGITERYEREVLPLIQALQEDDDLYDKKNGVLTAKGREVREAIVTKYGAKIRLVYGMEEESAIPTIDDEMIELLELHGYEVGKPDATKSSKDILEAFRSKQSEEDQKYIDHLMQTLINVRKPNSDSLDEAGKAK